MNGDLLIWKSNPNNADECSWKIEILESSYKVDHLRQSIQTSQSGFLNDGVTVVIGNKFGIIGNHKNPYENLEVVKGASTN